MIGGGLLGLEAAKALYDLESVTNVKIVIRGSYPLSRQLDDQGGEIVLRRIQAMGVEVLTHASTKRLVTSPIGGIETLTALEMEDGSSFETDIVIFAIGITPRDSLARDSAIRCSEGGPQHRGVIVDDQLRTSATDVFAIGECASWKGHTYGLIAPGIEMADILAFNMTQLTTAVGDFKPRQMVSFFILSSSFQVLIRDAEHSRLINKAEIDGCRCKFLHMIPISARLTEFSITGGFVRRFLR